MRKYKTTSEQNLEDLSSVAITQLIHEAVYADRLDEARQLRAILTERAGAPVEAPAEIKHGNRGWHYSADADDNMEEYGVREDD